MKEGPGDQRGTTTVLAADVCLHLRDERTPAGEPASPGTTHANDTWRIGAPTYTDLDLIHPFEVRAFSSAGKSRFLACQEPATSEPSGY